MLGYAQLGCMCMGCDMCCMYELAPCQNTGYDCITASANVPLLGAWPCTHDRNRLSPHACLLAVALSRYRGVLTQCGTGRDLALQQ